MTTADMTRIADESRIIHLAKATAVVMRAAWRSSVTARTTGAARATIIATPIPMRLQWCAVGLAVTAAGHLAFRAMMPATVVPALSPWLVIGIGTVAAAVAWQPAAFERAWRSSRVGARFAGHALQ